MTVRERQPERELGPDTISARRYVTDAKRREVAAAAASNKTAAAQPYTQRSKNVFRTRQRAKELTRPLRFKPWTEAERIQRQIETNGVGGQSSRWEPTQQLPSFRTVDPNKWVSATPFRLNFGKTAKDSALATTTTESKQQQSPPSQGDGYDNHSAFYGALRSSTYTAPMSSVPFSAVVPTNRFLQSASNYAPSRTRRQLRSSNSSTRRSATRQARDRPSSSGSFRGIRQQQQSARGSGGSGSNKAKSSWQVLSTMSNPSRCTGLESDGVAADVERDHILQSMLQTYRGW
jgi:hypothetical protein